MSAISGWKTRRLDEMGEIVSGSTPATGVPAFWNGDIVWVTPYDLSRLKSPYLADSAKKITPIGLAGSSTHLLPAKSLVMSSRAPIGYLALPIVDFCTNQGCKTFKLKSEIEPEFAYYNVAFNMHKIKNLGEGTTFAEISKTALSTIEMDFPKSFAEQSKIAEILSTVDQAIEQTEALIAKQQRIKTGLMQDLLTRGIDEHGQLRTEQTHAFKDSPLGRIPVEWEVARLGEVADISAGVTLGKSYEGPDTVELPYLRVANVQDGYLDLSEMKSIRVPNNHLEKYALKVGDVLMNEGGDFDKLGRGAVWRGQVPVCLHQNHVFKVRPHNETLASDFLAAVSESPYGKSFFMMASKQSTNLASINSTQLKAFPIPLPDYQEQIRIQTQFNRLAEVLNGSAAELKKQRSLKVALMQDLLTGRKRVTDLLEPATA
jgi:type I restriction enzyme S subunit